MKKQTILVGKCEKCLKTTRTFHDTEDIDAVLTYELKCKECGENIREAWADIINSK